MNKGIIKCLKNSIGEKGNYCYSLPVETTKAVIKELNRLNKEYERIYNENCKLREEHNITDIKLLDENERLNNIIEELKWKSIEEYDKSNYDWVLVKYFDGDYECVPCVAEKRFGKWYSIDEKEIQFDVKYFMDMQQLDKLKALKENNK